MVDSVSTQHPPAVKVGGRRLSISTKHRTPQISTAATTSSNEGSNEPEPPLDYPRPTANSTHSPIHHHTEEEQLPKKEKRQVHSDKKVREYAHVKCELTRPSKDNIGSRKGTSGIRISQPEGKALGV